MFNILITVCLSGTFIAEKSKYTQFRLNADELLYLDRIILMKIRKGIHKHTHTYDIGVTMCIPSLVLKLYA